MLCRTIIREHIPKKHLDFENPINNKKEFDNTVSRVYGEANQQVYGSNNTEYGTAKHSAAGIAKIGLKEAALERKIQQEVRDEIQK